MTELYLFDVVRRMTDWLETLPIPNALQWHRDEGEAVTFDGDGRAVKKISRKRDRYSNQNPDFVYEVEHSIISSVTGQPITTLFYAAEVGWHKTNIHMGSSVIAEYTADDENSAELIFKHTDPITGSSNETLASGVGGNDPVELEPLGARANPDPSELNLPNYSLGGSVANPETGCRIDGIEASPEMCSQSLANGTAEQCPNNYCGSKSVKITNPDGETRIFLSLPYMTFGNGIGGYFLPASTIGMSPAAQAGMLEDFLGDFDEGEDESNAADNFAYYFQEPDKKKKKRRGRLKFQCPPTIGKLLSNPRVRRLLRSAFDNSGHRTDTPREAGGWIYQGIRGNLIFRTAEDSRRGSGSIDLHNPPEVKNARVIATFHTHPFRNQDYLMRTNVDGRFGVWENTGPSFPDRDLAIERNIPGLVVYEAMNDAGTAPKIWYAGVGPTRAGFNPDEAESAEYGFPGNSLDTRKCR